MDDKMRTGTLGNLYFGKKLDADEEICITIKGDTHNWTECIGKENAVDIIKHLRDVFNVDS